MTKKILISANTFWNIHNFRIELINYLEKNNFKITIVTTIDKSFTKEYEKRFKVINLPIDRKSKNLFKDLILLIKYYLIIRREKPNFVLTYTIKPNIYASIAAHLLNIKIINNISGLGSSFIKNNIVTKIVILLYKIAFLNSKYIFFENNNDMTFFILKKIISPKKGYLIPGCGINIDYFKNFKPIQKNNLFQKRKEFNFLLIARLIKDKGLIEYIEAAKIVSRNNPNIEFGILGFEDTHNPTHIIKKDFEYMINDTNISYLGETDDVRAYIYNSNCVVLPSYREGTPKSLMEAMAMSKPIIATNVAGCIEVLEDNKNGYLCEVRNSQDLAKKMIKMINLQTSDRVSMGRFGLNKVSKEFDQNIINQKYISVINEY